MRRNYSVLDIQPHAFIRKKFSKDEMREMAVREASSHFMWHVEPAYSLNFISQTPKTCFLLSVKSFVESRSTRWRSEPYKISRSGRVPSNNQFVEKSNVWDYALPDYDTNKRYPGHFKSCMTVVSVPSSIRVDKCPACANGDTVKCTVCSGRSFIDCNKHDGPQGRCQCGDKRCQNGVKPCLECNSTGFEPCERCDGHRLIKHFLEVVIEYRTIDQNDLYTEDVVMTPSFPQQQLRKAAGNNIYKKAGKTVRHLSYGEIPRIELCSRKFLSDQAEEARGSRIHWQQQMVKQIPLTEIRYSYNGHTDTMWVYGKVNTVHFDNYPGRGRPILWITGGLLIAGGLVYFFMKD